MMTKDEELKEIRAARYGWLIVSLFSLALTVVTLFVKSPIAGEFWFFMLAFFASLFVHTVLYRHRRWVLNDKTDFSIFE